MSTLKHTFKLMLAGFILLNLSCKKTKSKPQETTPSIEQPIEQPIKKIYLPVRIESDRLVINLKYLGNTAFLTEISNSDYAVSKITYDENQQLKKVEQLKNNKLFHYTDYMIVNNKITSARSFNKEGKAENPAGYYDLTYNDQGQLSDIKAYSPQNMLIGKNAFTYAASGNISSLSIIDISNQTNSFEYSYDVKNGIFKYLKHAQLLFMELEYAFFYHAQNNPLSYSNIENPQENINFSYQYNEENYPSQITINKSNNKQTYAISYKELKP